MAYQRWQLTKIERFNYALMRMVKVKVPVLIQASCYEYTRVKVRLQAFTTWALDGW